MTQATPETAKTEFVNEHVHYPDIMPAGIESYGFIQTRVNPIFYEIPEGSKVLDVGCNSGEFMRLLQSKKQCDVTGADISEEMVALCRQKGLNVVRCDADKLPFPDGTFDVVTLMEVLEHFHEPVPYLKEIRRVLKKDGMLLGSCPHANLERYIHDDGRLHHQYYSELGIKNDLEQAFDQCYLRILTGGQFSVSMATSYLGGEPCEILFKAGGKTCQPWEERIKTETKLRVWFAPTQLAGTVYYRMLSFAEKMDELGLIEAAYEKAPWDQMDERVRGWQRRLVSADRGTVRLTVAGKQLEDCLKIADLSVWQIAMNRHVLSFFRCAKDVADQVWSKETGKFKAFVTEIDDNLFDVPTGNIAVHPYQPHSEMEWIAQKQIEMSDALIVSTQYLADKFQTLYPQKPLYIAPNSIDFSVWDNLLDLPKFEAKKPGFIRIGYTGCSNHRKDLDMIKEALCAILTEFENVEFLFTPQPEPGGIFTGWEGIPRMGVINQFATIDKFPAFIKSWDMDIGVAPLRDNEFNRAKSNLRWLEYSALKIPTIASRVYPFKNSIRHGEDGLIANTSQEWYDALKTLIIDQSKRQAIGERAYARVKADFNLEKTARRYAEILEEIRCSVQISKRSVAVS